MDVLRGQSGTSFTRLLFGAWMLLLALVAKQSHGFQSGLAVQSDTWGTQSLLFQTDRDPPHRGYRMMGAPSCAASACHGGPRAGVAATEALRGSEYRLWIQSDPHARSWRTLNSNRSIEILHRLNILSDGKIVDRIAYQNCLACHNTSAEIASDGISPMLPEGVGCEACHGPSELWRGTHYQGPENVPAAIVQHGLVDTKLEFTRAKVCTLCHVGGPDRDMNHDIIAAGHPALYFDYGTYLKAYPKHWRDDKVNQQNATLSRWLVGQLAKADSELELLEARITKARPNSIWPEFSNFQCTSCHKNINESNLGNAAGEPKVLAGPSTLGSQGRTPVRMWNLEGLMVADLAFELESSVTNQLLQSIANNASNISNSSGELAKIQSLIRSKRTELAQVIVDFHQRENDSVLANWSLQNQRQWTRKSWDSVAKSYNWESAALAYIATLASSPSPAQEIVLEQLHKQLIFPESTQSPASYDPRVFADQLDQLQLNP